MKKLLMFLFISIGMLQYANAQTVTGIITGSDDGEPLPGVNIQIKGTTTGTITDLEGKYTIEVSGEAPVLLFSFIGYTPKEVAVNGQTTIDVQLEVETTGIDEIVVVGYGVQKKSLVTGAIAKVDGEELTKGANLRVTQALQGKTAGVVISNNSGQPGEFVSVRIRGTGTNGDNEPLYIIDGLPNNGHGIDYLATEDIESIEVLKDAASAAIYGARAANGVVLITTKRGKTNSNAEVSYSGWYGVQNPWRKVGVVSKDDYIMLRNEAALNAGKTPVFDQARIDTMANTDWQDEMFYLNAPKMSHSISLTGGNDKLTYSSSLSYFEQDGIVAKGHSNFERINYRLNTTGKFGFLTIGANLNYANIKTKGVAANDFYSANSLANALLLPPVIPVYNVDGSFATPDSYGLIMNELTNPIGQLSYQHNETKTNKFIGNLYAEFDFGDIFGVLKGLKFKTSYGTEFSLVSERGFTPIYQLDSKHYSTVSRASSSMHLWQRFNFDNILTYTKSFGSHNISALIGHSAFKDWNSDIGGKKDDLLFDDFDRAYINNGTDTESEDIYGGYGEHTLLSYFARVNYDLMDKYMLTAIVRADGSSNFGSKNKFGYFPSVSVGWVLSRESFMSQLESVVNFAKLRVSWGQNGNENIGAFGYTSVMTNGAVYYFGDDKTSYPGAQPERIANPALKWETSEQTNVGLDLQFLNNMISLTADYYIKKTKDWLVEAPVPMMVGNRAPIINGGDIKNTGIELELGYHQKVGDLKVDITVTGAYNKNEVLDIKNEAKRLSGGKGGHNMDNVIVAEVGRPMGYFSGYETNGIFQNITEVNAYAVNGKLIQEKAKPGDLRFVDQNGDGVLDDDDLVMIGDPNPDFTGGLNINIEWKGLDLNMFWYAALGHQVWNATSRSDLSNANYRYEALGRWTGDGTSNDYPIITENDANGNWSTASDFFVEDADFLRLRNLSIGYTLPEKVVKYIKVKRLRVYIATENLFTFTKYNGFEPEIGGGVFDHGIDKGIYPQARTFLGGINITF